MNKHIKTKLTLKSGIITVIIKWKAEFHKITSLTFTKKCSIGPFLCVWKFSNTHFTNVSEKCPRVLALISNVRNMYLSKRHCASMLLKKACLEPAQEHRRHLVYKQWNASPQFQSLQPLSLLYQLIHHGCQFAKSC